MTAYANPAHAPVRCGLDIEHGAHRWIDGPDEGAHACDGGVDQDDTADIDDRLCLICGHTYGELPLPMIPGVRPGEWAHEGCAADQQHAHKRDRY